MYLKGVPSSSIYLKFRDKITRLSYPISVNLGPLRKKLMSEEETMNYIIHNKCSVSRFGDGEFGIMRNQAIGFQNTNHDLSCQLRYIAGNPIPGHLVCIPYALRSINGLKEVAKRFWVGEIGIKYMLWYYIFRKHKIFGSTQISRFYIDYVKDTHAKNIIPLWKKLWNNKKLLIVEGRDTRLGYGNDLFNNAISVNRILCPPKDAFAHYNDILQTAINSYKKMGDNTLILIALGPTATILAYDLAKYDIWSIDIGHIDLEYEWFKMGAKSKVNIPLKAVNEVAGGLSVTQIEDEHYINSILAEIK